MPAVIGQKPWKIMPARAPISEPGVAWFNAVTRALMGLEIRDSGDGTAYVQRPNASGEKWTLFLPLNPNAEASPLWGIINDRANEQYIVAGRQVILHRYGPGVDPIAPLRWSTASQTIAYSALTDGPNAIYLSFDPETTGDPGTATIIHKPTTAAGLDDPSELDGSRINERICRVDYDATGATSSIIPPIHHPGNVAILPLWGDHPVEVSES